MLTQETLQPVSKGCPHIPFQCLWRESDYREAYNKGEAPASKEAPELRPRESRRRMFECINKCWNGCGDDRQGAALGSEPDTWPND
ncbi:unnamed protein product [Leptosia nina]|uniref:Uncharacterized protein n=1 Tax=Leptosia nina TaxID=320188 RepID=A0AAV1K1G6_9NEOP